MITSRTAALRGMHAVSCCMYLQPHSHTYNHIYSKSHPQVQPDTTAAHNVQPPRLTQPGYMYRQSHSHTYNHVYSKSHPQVQPQTQQLLTMYSHLQLVSHSLATCTDSLTGTTTHTMRTFPNYSPIYNYHYSYPHHPQALCHPYSHSWTHIRLQSSTIVLHT